MWNIGQEKQVQMDLSILDPKTQNIDYIIEFLYLKLLPEGKQPNSLERLYELLLNSLLYGQSVKTLQMQCPFCQGITENEIDVLKSIKYTPSNTAKIDNSEMDFKEFLDIDLGILEINTEVNCLLCQKKITLVITDPKKIIEDYIFSYNLPEYYQLILFFKDFGFSIEEVNSLTPLEVKYLQNLIIEREEKKLQESKN